MGIEQTNETDQLLEINGGSNNSISLKGGNLVEDGGVHVFDTSVNLVQDPASVFVESDYPIILDITINLVAVYLPGTIILMKHAKGLGCIQNATGEKDGKPANN